MRVAAIPRDDGDLVRLRLGSIEVSQHERYDGVADKSSKPTSHRARTSEDYCNPGRYKSVFPHRHG